MLSQFNQEVSGSILFSLTVQKYDSARWFEGINLNIYKIAAPNIKRILGMLSYKFQINYLSLSSLQNDKTPSIWRFEDSCLNVRAEEFSKGFLNNCSMIVIMVRIMCVEAVD